MQATHRHKKESETTGAYMWPVGRGSMGYHRMNPEAHGWQMVTATCACGAIRRTNENQGHVERGPWQKEEV